MSIGEDNGKPESAKPIRYTIPPRIQSQIVLKTLPNSVCTLYKEGDSISDSSLKLYADQEGLIHFFVCPDVESDVVIRVVVRCEVDDKVVQFPLELLSSFSPTHGMPSPPKTNSSSSQMNNPVRPALSEEELLNLSDEELHKRGYPFRPDPKESPRAFDDWKKIVSVPMTIVEPRQVTNHGFSNSPTKTKGRFHDTDRGWSGYVLRDEYKIGPNKFRQRQYKWVYGIWSVPNVSGAEENNIAHSSFWVGLDGWKHDDLVQAGTHQNAVDFVFGSVRWIFSYFYVWTEFLPQEPSEKRITSFDDVSPGDEIYVTVYIGDRNFPVPNLNGPDAIFNIANMTKRKQTTVYTSRTWMDENGNIIRDGAWQSHSNYSWGLGSCLGDGGSYLVWPSYRSSKL